MTSKLAVRLILILALQGFWVAIAHAQTAYSQSTVCYRYLTANDLGVDLGNAPPKGAFIVYQNSIPGESGESVYAVPTNSCVPPCLNCCGGSGGAPGGNGAGEPNGSVATCGEPINLATGNTYISQTDLRVPGLSGGLTLSRMWNSLWPQSQISNQVGLFGPNWRSTYEERVFLAGDGYVTYSRSAGNFWTFAWQSGTTYGVAAPASANATLSLNSNSTQWTLTFQNGETRTFSYLSGSLTAIIDRNGNSTQLTYDSLNRLVTVTDPGGRHLYFSYSNNSSYLVTGVTSDVGISLSYAYDSQGRLIQVTNPNLTTLNFAYDSNSSITAVTDSAGKILESHSYDSLGRGLSSSRANGVEAVTVTYPSQ